MADNRIVDRRRGAVRIVSLAFVAIVALAALAFGAERAAAATILLEIDATNPSAAVFTATGAAATVSTSLPGAAIILDGSLTGSSRFAALPTSGSTLMADESDYRYGIISATGTGGALRLTCCGNQTQTFVAGEPAFEGSSVFDLSRFPLVTTNIVGDIVISDNNGDNTGIVIGQYRLIVTVPVPVPVPPSLALMVGGLALMGFALRRRRAA